MIREPLMTTDHLVVTPSAMAMSSILDEWRWLVGNEKRPFLVTACGDVFVEDALDRTIHFLNVSAPALSPVAETRQAFEALLAEPSFLKVHLHLERVAMLRGKGLLLKENEIYSFRTPLSLGGQINEENIQITDVEVHFSIAGQIACQIADIPVGSPITGITINRLPSTKRWWKFWRRPA